MKSKNYLKSINIVLIIAIFIVSVEASTGVSTPVVTSKTESNNFINSLQLTHQLPIPRPLIPRSIKGLISTTNNFQKQTKSNIDCNTTVMLCGFFEGNTTLENVSSWMGFEFKDSTGKYFIATYGQKAKDLGNRFYSTKKWDKGHLWLNIGKNSVPLALQTRFAGIDKESGNEWHTVDYLGYRGADLGIDYSNYLEHMSTSTLVLLINPKTKEVIKHHLEYYDENGEYVDTYQIEVGDEIESYFLGFSRKEKDVVYLFSVEDITPVTSPITFTYKEQYPGKDFNCTNCGDLNLAEVEFKYMFEAYGETRSSFTEPQALVKKANSANNSNSSKNTNKSVPLSSLWMLLFLMSAITMIRLKKMKT